MIVSRQAASYSPHYPSIEPDTPEPNTLRPSTSTKSNTSEHPPADRETQRQLPTHRLKRNRDWLHYAAYFVGVGSLVFVAQSDEPKQIESAVIAGSIAAGCVISRDWYKARLDPTMANDPSALIGLFNEMLHAGRAQVNINAAHLKRVEFLQTDLVEAMREFNDMLRLDPAEVEQRLRGVQSANLTDALSAVNLPPRSPLGQPISSSIDAAPSTGSTYVPPSETVRQSTQLRRPGFDA